MFERRTIADPQELRLETRADGLISVSGYAAVFYRKDEPGTEYQLWDDMYERIARGAFQQAITGDDVRALFNHDPDHILGRVGSGTLQLREDKTGLRYTISMPDTPTAKSVAESIRRGDISGSSFSFQVREGGEEFSEQVREGKRVIVRTLTNLRIADVGPVTFPAYAGTTTELARRSVNLWESARVDLSEIARRRQELLELELTF